MKRATLIHALLATALLITQPTLALANGPIEPAPLQERAGQVVGELLSRYHYNDLQTDDHLSEAVYQAYFDALDPQRFYFTEADLEAFSHRSDRLDDEIESGRLDTAYAIFERYRQRVIERSDHALEVLASDLEFDSTETLELDRSEADWAGSSAQLDELWRKRVVNDVLTQKLNGRSTDEIKESLQGRYARLSRTLAQYSAEDVFQIFMTAWAGEFDPHSSYMSPRTSENFDINMRLSLEGIGALLSSEGEFVEIVELIAGGPAETSGQLQAGDRIVGVGQQRQDIRDVVGWRLPDVVDLIRGPKGSEVHLRILPARTGSDSRERIITLTRNTIELEERAARAERLEVDRDSGMQRIGVIEIPAFYADFGAANAGDENYRSTTRDVSELLASDELADIDGLVIDLRGNAGGSLEEAVRMTGLFIDQGPVVQVHRSNGRREVLMDPAAEPAVYDGPLGVLVDGRSASASEIFAAAMQDYGRGVLMGDQTFGKGTVQTLVGLERFGVGDDETPSGRLKLTIAKFYRINGESTQLEGVMPDLEMPYPHANDAMGERAADNALPWDTIRAADYARLNHLDGMINTLRRHHQERLRRDPALQAVAGEARRLEMEQENTRVSLNEAERRARIDAAESARLAAINAQLTAYGKAPLERLDDMDPDALPDVLLDEAAEVVADLAELQAGRTPRLAGRLSPVQAAAR